MRRISVMNSRKHMLVLGVIYLGCDAAMAHDWASWRGPEQNGLSRESAPALSWSPEGENLLWKSRVGGRTTPIVMGDHVYIVGRLGEGECSRERVVCLDANTGKMIWEHRYNVFHTDIVENRVGWPAPVGDSKTGRLYVHGTGGELFCFERDGKIAWKISMTEVFGRISGYGGRIHTPILDENRLIISFLSSNWGNHAKPSHRYIAIDKNDGTVLWWATPGGKPLDTTYACPVVAVIDGVRQLIVGDADGSVYGLKARTGEKLWSFRFSRRGLNSSPVVHGNYVYVGQSEENIEGNEMGRVVCIDATKRGDITEIGEVWRLHEKTVGYASPAIGNDRLYMIDNSATLYAVDLKTGTIHWEYSLGRVGKGSPLVTRDGIIYVGEQTGYFHILKDDGDKCTSLNRHEFKRDDGLVDEIYGSPALSNGRLIFMTRYGSYCLKDTSLAHKQEAVPALAQETGGLGAGDKSGGGQGRHCHVEPAELTISPGERVNFKALVNGPSGLNFRPIRDAKWSLAGIGGSINEQGEYTAPSDKAYAGGLIKVSGEGLESSARVRIVPSLPIHVDFEEMEIGKVPPGWVGVAVKTRIDERDGSRVLRKLASKERPSPPVMRLRAYSTPPIEGGYVVQADMLSLPKKRFKSDIGLINSRYYLVMTGRNKLRLESWSAIPRIRHDTPYSWETEAWYTAKLEVKLEGEQARVRAKVWPRDSAEPSEWTIEIVDPCPNREGSAGLYAYSTFTTAKSDGPEAFFDNFRVWKEE